MEINYLEHLTNTINIIVKIYRKINCVKVSIGKSETQWNEEQVRAFQIYVHHCSDKEFEHLVKNVTIYSGPSMRKMELRRDGKFSNSFDDGFYNSSGNMALEIL